MPLDEFRAFPEQFFASKADRIDALGGLYDIKSAQAEIASMSRGFEQMRDRAAQACRMATLEARRKQMDALLVNWDPMWVIASPFPPRPAVERNELADREEAHKRRNFPWRYVTD